MSFPPPTAYGATATSDGTYAYTAGGYSFDTGTTIDVFQRFDPVANSWTVLAPMLQGAIMSSAVYSPINNKVYVFGGEDAVSGVNYNLTQIYDIVSGTWSMGATMPDVRSFMASGYSNGKIYLVAGYNTGFVDSAQRQVWEYDPIANTFTTTRMLYPNTNGVGGPGFGIINGHFYVAGGRDLTNTVIALVYDYDIGADTWTQRASLPSANNVPGSGVENGLLAVFGGGNPFAFAPATTGATVLYDPGSDTWTNGPTLTQIRSFPAGTAVGNTLVAAGGYTGVSTTSSTETTACTAGGGCPVCPAYLTTTSTGNPIVPGTVDIGNHCDDCATAITLPFPVILYGTSYTTVNASSNGSLDFIGSASPFGTSCPLPDARIDRSILPYQADLFTVNAGYGIFTSISGVAPNRIFNIEWREQYFPGTGNANFEVRLYETGACFDVIYGATDDSGSGEESGVQKSPSGPATQFSCLEATLTSGLKVTYCPNNCPAPVPADAVSRMVHGGAGTFDIELPRVPIDGAVGIEDRTQGAPSVGWTIVASYPLVSESVAVASDGTFAYGAGGFAGGPTDSFNRYDPVANTWTPLPNVPTAFYDAPAVYAPNTNSIYVFGGIDPSFTVMATTQVYNITTGTWSTGAPMPDANGRYFASAAYYNGKIYVIGGFDGATFSEQSQTWEYDPIANTWNTSRAPIPVPMGGAGYSIVGQNIYLAGHWNGGLGSTDHYRYDIVADTWSARAPVPVAIYRPDAAGIGTNTYLVGGGNPFLGASATRQARIAASLRAPATSYNSTYIYDTVGDAWTTGPSTHVPHSFTGGTAIGNLLIVVTGYNGTSGDTSTVEALTSGGFAYQIVVTFALDVTVDSASVTTGIGNIDSFSVSGSVVTVNLSGVTNAQRLGVTLGNVCDGTIAGDVLIPMGVLSGDTNANGAVNASDVSQTKSQSGAVVGAGNFREDVNANGSINAADIALVKSKSGTALPP